jgi:hypothetical protein
MDKEGTRQRLPKWQAGGEYDQRIAKERKYERTVRREARTANRWNSLVFQRFAFSSLRAFAIVQD